MISREVTILTWRLFIASVAEQHSVRLYMSALDRQFCSVGRKPKPRNLLGGEVRELASRGIIEWLLPQVIDTFFANGVHHGFGIGGKRQRRGSSLVPIIIILRLFFYLIHTQYH